jgi:hypothetical protein
MAEPAASTPPPSRRARRLDALAQTVAMALAFVLSAWALFVAHNGAATLISLVAGFALWLSRLRQSRADTEARLGLAEELELARLLLGRGAYAQALPIARRVAEQAQLTRTQQSALETVAWCELGLGRPGPARAALSWVRPQEALDVLCCAAVEDACGDTLWALHLLETAARRGPITREARLFWIDLCARSRGIEAACWLTLQQLKCLRPEDAERVLEFARSAPSAAARALALALQHERAAPA